MGELYKINNNIGKINNIVAMKTSPYAPVVVTMDVSGYTTGATTVVLVGKVTYDGGSAITDRGFVWGTGTTPTLANSHVHLTGSTGTFDYRITGLTTGTTYYYRTFATNSIGTSYGISIMFKIFKPLNPWTNLTHYWKFNGDCNDSVGAINGTLTGVVNYLTTVYRRDTGAEMSQGYYQLASDGRTEFGLQTYSIALWVYIGDNFGAQDCLWSFDYTSHASPYYAQHLRFGWFGDLVFYWNRAGAAKGIGTTTSTQCVPSSWNHVVITLTTSKAALYVNGVKASENTGDTGNVTYYNQEVWIGKSNFNTNMAGGKVIDEYAFFTRELSIDDITMLYSYGKGVYY